MSDDVVTIVKIGAEGGSITLEGRRDAAHGWQFRLATNERAMWDMLGEKPSPQEEGPWVSSWKEALTLLERYPWPRLHPLVVHPEFREAVLTAIGKHAEGGPERVRLWRDELD